MFCIIGFIYIHFEDNSPTTFLPCSQVTKDQDAIELAIYYNEEVKT